MNHRAHRDRRASIVIARSPYPRSGVTACGILGVTKQSSTVRRVAPGLLRCARNDAAVFVAPAKAGAQRPHLTPHRPWIPAFAGMTDEVRKLVEE